MLFSFIIMIKYFFRVIYQGSQIIPSSSRAVTNKNLRETFEFLFEFSLGGFDEPSL
jgi:hypothetical protein